MTAALAVGLLAAGGAYLVLQRERLRVVIGFVLLGHAVNVLFVAAGGLGDRGAPLAGSAGTDDAADPLPQAFVLTAIVITLGLTVYLLALLRSDLTGAPADPARDHPRGPDGQAGPSDGAVEGAPPAPAPEAEGDR